MPDYENGEHFETLEVAQLGVGAVLGDLSMLDNTITSASVKAIMTCRIGFINKENVTMMTTVVLEIRESRQMEGDGDPTEGAVQTPLPRWMDQE